MYEVIQIQLQLNHENHHDSVNTLKHRNKINYPGFLVFFQTLGIIRYEVATG